MISFQPQNPNPSIAKSNTARKSRRQPITAWIKSRVSQYDHCPGEYNPEAGKIVPAQGTRTSNKQFIGLINREGPWYSKLNNELLTRHTTGQQVRYTSGSTDKTTDNLANIDVDCHGKGTPKDAYEFVEHASQVLGQPIFAEPSTNKTGAHGYVTVDREGEGSAAVNDGLFSLEAFLNRLMRMGRPDGTPWNISGVEVKGSCAKARWDAKGKCTGYTAGSLMKLPMTFLDSPEREEELRGTARLSLTQLGALHKKKLPDYLSAAPKESTGGNTAPSISCPHKVSSTKSHPIKRYHIERLETTYGATARKVFPEVVRSESSRHVADRYSQSVYLLVVAYCTDSQGDDKAMPSKRIYAIWKALYDEGDVSKAPDHGVIAALRNHLSQNGNIEWVDNQFWTPDKPNFRPDGTQKGVCCKYSLNHKIMAEFGFTTQCVQRETIASTRIHSSQYHTILAAYYDNDDPTTDYIRPQRVGWASEYYGMAA
jgi:hypothetical protein